MSEQEKFLREAVTITPPVKPVPMDIVRKTYPGKLTPTPDTGLIECVARAIDPEAFTKRSGNVGFRAWRNRHNRAMEKAKAAISAMGRYAPKMDEGKELIKEILEMGQFYITAVEANVQHKADFEAWETKAKGYLRVEGE